MVLQCVPDPFIEASLCLPFTEDSSPASSVWSPMQVWSVLFIRWARRQQRSSELLFWKDANCLFCNCSQSWAGQKAIPPTTVTPNCFSSALWRSLLDKSPVTRWRWSELSSKRRVSALIHSAQFTVSYEAFMWECFTHVCLSCSSAFRSDSRPASGVLPGLIGIYERYGIKGYYNGMGASFVRAIPCALMNYTLTRKFENVFSSLESWGN